MEGALDYLVRYWKVHGMTANCKVLFGQQQSYEKFHELRALVRNNHMVDSPAGDSI